VTNQPTQPASGGTAKAPQQSLGQGFRFPPWRAPTRLDALLFFLALPVGLALMFSLVEIRLTKDVPYNEAIIYMVLHMFIAWWTVSLGCYLIKFLCRNWRPPARFVCVMGFVIALIPAAMMYQTLGNYYETISPAFAANWTGFQQPSWDFEYLLYFVRFSIPALPLFLIGVYGYRLLTGVSFFGYEPRFPAVQQGDSSAEPRWQTPRIGQIGDSKLPADAVILAVKAEQHYVQIWTNEGEDLLRFRFSDVPATLSASNGAQVHRSWWVNFDAVTEIIEAGKKTELKINDELSVPVSRSYKNAVREHMNLSQAPA